LSPDFLTRKIFSCSLYEITLLGAEDEKLVEISNSLALGLNLEEMVRIQKYFKKKQRNPTDIELQMIGQTWSEHCFHKTFKGNIVFNGIPITNLLKTYISKATRELDPEWCISVFEDDAGIIKFTTDYGIAVKVETHNHPSAIEPFGGAATGVGGVIRDVLAVWADPIACTNVLGFGPLNFPHENLPKGVKHPKYVYLGVTAGIGSYGNNMGIPTVNGAICFDESYVGNVVVYCGCVGILPLQKFVKSTRINDVIVLAGGKTGKDGIHGVTFASAELNEKSEEVSRSAVQIANPIEEEKLKRAIISIRDLSLASGITDLGGGGLSSAIGETAKKFGCGAIINLEKVPLKEKSLAPWEIYISESQERMLLSVCPKNLDRVLTTFQNEAVEATAIGHYSSDNTLALYYLNEKIAEIDIPFIFNPPIITKTARYLPIAQKNPDFPEPKDLLKILLNLLSSPNVASKGNVIRTYDHEVKGNTVIKPLQGRYSGPNDAAVLKPLDSTWQGIVISCGINSKFGKLDTYWMAASAIDEALRNNIAVGGRRIALLDNFTWGNPDKPERLGGLVRACQACYDHAIAFKTPFISGKDSLYNESPLGSVTPTLLVSAIGILPDIRQAISVDIKSPGNPLYLVGSTYNELGGSEYYQLNGFLSGMVPKVRPDQAAKTFQSITRAIDSSLINACHDLSEGGLAVSAAEMAFSGGYGIELDVALIPQKEPSGNWRRNDLLLFSESNSRFLVEVPKHRKEDFENIMRETTFAQVGKTLSEDQLTVYGLTGKPVIEASLEELLHSWDQTFT